MNDQVIQQWAPSASIAVLRHRADIIQKIRQFFLKNNVLEVETPLLSSAAVSDPELSPFEIQSQIYKKTYYLATSPEYHMKRLLASGSGPIFQITKAFRQDEVGRLHNPEFTLLEWYRPDFSANDLMDEVDALLNVILGCPPALKLTYEAVFEQYLGINPFTVSTAVLETLAVKHHLVLAKPNPKYRTMLLQFLFSCGIEPHLGKERPVFVENFPAEQSALAELSSEDPKVAKRFELYLNGLELANGFVELRDAFEQAERFKKDAAYCKTYLGQVRPIDRKLLAALRYGLPECSGIALGLDRLIMLALSRSELNSVISFGWQNA